MKALFFQLPQGKQDRIISACLDEFGSRDYDQASLDRMVQRAGISKGGLYEYIDHKEDLYLHLIDRVYAGLYSCFEPKGLPAPFLERFRAASARAVDFYLDHPKCIALLVRSSRLGDAGLSARVGEIFNRHFDSLFDPADQSALRFGKTPVMDLMKLLLAKTRADFLVQYQSGADRQAIKNHYTAEWDFFLSVLEKGILAK